MVDPLPGATLFDLGGLQVALEDLLGIRVDLLTPGDLPERISAGGGAAAILARSGDRPLTLRELEREYILETLKQTGGNKSKAAALLGLDRKTLYRKLDEYRAENQAVYPEPA